MAHRWLGLAALAVALAVAMSCGSDRGAIPPEEQAANDVPVAVLFYPTIGFQQSPPYEATGGRGTTQWNAYMGHPVLLSLVPGRDSSKHGRKSDGMHPKT